MTLVTLTPERYVYRSGGYNCEITLYRRRSWRWRVYRDSRTVARGAAYLKCKAFQAAESAIEERRNG